MGVSPLSMEDALVREIERYVAESPDNRRHKLDGLPYFGKPLVGFARGSNPLFNRFKQVVGPHHLTPGELLEGAFPEHRGGFDDASVISFVVPIADDTRKSNRGQKRYPSKAWSHTRTYGQECIGKLADHVADFIIRQGFPAVVSMASPLYKEMFTGKDDFITSNWSERHAAFAAGLGTFGLSGCLITPRGVAVRFGSVVTTMALRPTPGSYSDFRQYCLYFNSGTCGKCMRRCPSGSITQNGHNHESCMTYFADIVEHTADYDASLPGCGLCQTAVPCESGIPSPPRRRGDNIHA